MDIQPIILALVHLVWKNATPEQANLVVGIIMMLLAYFASHIPAKYKAKKAEVVNISKGIDTGLVMGVEIAQQQITSKPNVEKSAAVQKVLKMALADTKLPTIDNKVGNVIEKAGGAITFISNAVSLLQKVSPLFKR